MIGSAEAEAHVCNARCGKYHLAAGAASSLVPTVRYVDRSASGTYMLEGRWSYVVGGRFPGELSYFPISIYGDGGTDVLRN